MRFILRAATIAAAAITLTVTTLFAGPSFAVEMESAPVVPAYAAHAAANLNSNALLLNTVESSTAQNRDDDFGTPVAQHAVATLVAEADPEVEPAQADGRSLHELVDEFASSEVPSEEHRCLAGAVYFESKGEPLQGQLAVAEVIINRAESGRFASSLCGVVKQRGQFSFIRGGRFPAIPTASKAWRKAVAIAHIAQRELAESSAPKALFFHATRVSPRWKDLKRVATVGNHVFYR